MSEPLLHGFFRSGASYRVRIALGLKGIAYGNVSYSLRDGAQRSPAYLALNPQGLVPALEIDGTVLTQSLAIIEYLDETHDGPRLLPADPILRAHVRAAAQVIAIDTHPIQNLKVLGWVKALGGDESAWAARVIEEGFAAFDALIAPYAGRFCFGDTVTLADVCLVPQLVNARRFGAKDIPARLLAIEEACLALPAFDAARPENQPDAV
ncbi:maleylacetoacetate isomerase [Novosphingobium sp. SG707]|uniref:maleylacetoacetate isomerase n=1 Tax=Novosphingobium sp. SG707 TaxID=2586996 RepID=UPI001444A472|nr:maleylacetoacetate isomerase [Novosphingobium sp. SG707]NKJ02892.1 maleylpyruvate isomerase [Novosphingobium sp. SG707]